MTLDPSPAQDTEQPGHPHQYKIIVNARERTVETAVLSYEQVVALAFDPAPPNPVIYTVTFRHADQHPETGTLLPGETVKIMNGTVFNVVATSRS